jgi:molecular chaperone GrpE
MTGKKSRRIKLIKGKDKTTKLVKLLQRTQADFENFRKRAEKEKAELTKFANESLILELLPVLDNFERSLKITPKDSPIGQGIRLIKRQLGDILAQNGVEKIETKIGDRFDPAICEAVAGTGDRIAEIVLDGYRLNGKVIRTVKVKVKKN